jgi:starch synthase (maltosyl-transferring)
VNRIRKDNPALQSNCHLHFHPVSNEELICYSKHTDDGSNLILVVANLDPHHIQAGWVDLDIAALGIQPDESYQVHDLLGESRYLWSGSHNYVELNPHVTAAHVFLVRRRVHTERDFDYFM